MPAPRRKSLTCFISHAPHFESCMPVLLALHRRGRVDVAPVISARMKHTDPGIVQALRDSGIPHRFVTRARIELFSWLDLRRADAVLSYGDPLAWRKALRLRDGFLIRSGKPSVFIQHGLLQEGINLDDPKLGDRWYASLLLWWDRLDPAVSSFLSQEVRARVRRVGFIKRNCLGLRPVPSAVAQRLAGYRQRLLVATSVPGQTHRFSLETLDRTYAMFADFARANPDVLLIMRPHRGKQDDLGRRLDETLAAAHDNVIVMDRYKGDFAYWNIHDSLQMCDGVVAHASSAVLDALYADKPTAMLYNDWPVFDGLTDIRTLDALSGFSAGLAGIDPRANPVRQRFGELDANLDMAAALIEDLLLRPGH